MSKKSSRRQPLSPRRFGIAFIFCLLIVSGLFWSAKTEAAARTDDTFGGGGKVISKIGTYETVGYDVAVQTDGKIVMVGSVQNWVGSSTGPDSFIVARYNSDGTPDTSFDGDGMVIGQFRAAGEYSASRADSVKIQPDGKIVVAGTSGISLNGVVNTDFGVARFNSNGSFDTSFSEDGTTTAVFGQQFDRLTAMDIQPNGKIVLAGNTDNNSQGLGFPAIVRLNSDGSSDSTFSGDGAITYVNEIFGYAQAVLSQPDGKILLVISNAAECILRYNEDGSLDRTFGTNGIVTNTISGGVSIALQTDGKIIVGGNNAAEITDFLIYRFNPNGSPDNTFNNSGAVSVSFGDYRDQLNDLAVQPDGKIVAAGYSDPVFGFSDNIDFALARLNPNGSLDTTFDSDGKVITPVSNLSSEARAVAIQPNGKITAVGSAYLGRVIGRGDAALVRYTGDIKTADFDGDTKTDISVWRPSNGTWYFMQSSGGSGGVLWGLGSDKPVPGDYTGDGKTDVAVFRPSTGQWFILRSENSTYYAVSFGDANDVPASADYDGDGRTDIGVFRPSNGYWYHLRSSNNQFVAQQFGQTGDKPVPGDFDGDGLSDKAVYRGGNWYISQSSNGSFRGIAFGNGTDRPISGDFDGDNKTDIAVFRPNANGNNAEFYILQSSDAAFKALPFGIIIDIPVIGDYDGDGKSDIAVFRPSNGAWYINRSSQGFAGVIFGQAADKPIPAGYLPDNSFQFP